MRWLPTEYLLKGLFLGLLADAALGLAAVPPGGGADALLRVNLPAYGGLALALLAAALLKRRQGYRARGRPVVYALFLLLESPTLVYAGVLGGTFVGTLLLPQPGGESLLLPAAAGGAAVGLAFGLLRQVRRREARLGLALALAAGLVGGALYGLGLLGDAGARPPVNPPLFGGQLLLGIPLFYVLTFAGHEEESEAEFGAVCALLGLGLTTLAGEVGPLRPLGFLLPLLLYLWYTMRVLPALRVLKFAFRALGYARSGRPRSALQAFRRALQLDPNNKLAREGYWDLHRSLDVDQLAKDPDTLGLVDLDLCLERVAALLTPAGPAPARIDEAHRLLDLVARLRPELGPAVDYWRAVAHTHARQYEAAADALARVLDPQPYGAAGATRRDVLLPAWRLALDVGELRRRVGAAELAKPGRRLEAIVAVERHLSEYRDDQDVWGIKRLLYHEVTEADYDAYAGEGRTADGFDHEYAQQLGLALIDDDARWPRGGEYLRLAARGLPAQGPTLFGRVARAQQRAGQADAARHSYELAKRAGRGVGPAALAEPEREAYFFAVKTLADDAQARGDLAAAIENLHLYAESARSGLETLRTLAGLYERKGDPLGAARVTDQALVYNAKDTDLLERKERYYYSVLPEHLRDRLESVRGWFDVDYCLRRSRQILDGRYDDPEWLDVARHLAELALVARPDSPAAKVLLARARLRYGERDEALALLEQVRGPEKPETFASAEEEDAWYTACQLLGDLYVEAGRADLGVACYLDFRKSSKSGARTLFKLAQAYEQLGDVPRAVRCYRQVTAYQGNPLTPEAYDALHRLGA
jgi:tetratricopeptide (TPR) repeat protein